MSDPVPVTLFYSYAHEDEEHRQDLEGHLKILERRGKLKPWHDRKIAPGVEWDQEIDENLLSAELILLLVSMDFINSDYIWGKELKVAMDQHQSGDARVVPIFVRAVSIERDEAPFMKLQGLPTDLRPVTSWPNVDEAWTNVVKGLRATVADIQAHRNAAPPLAAPAAGGAGSSGPSAAPQTRGRPDPRLGTARIARRVLTWASDRVRDLFPSGVLGGPTDIVLGPGGGSTEGAPSGQSLADDPLLDRVVDSIVGQIEHANAVRTVGADGSPPPDLDAIRQQVLRLIDTPEQKRVLWVDDNPAGNNHEVAALAKLQIEVVAVHSTAEATARIGTDPESFDLVLSDWERRADGARAGLQLLEQLRSAGKAVPLIFYHGAFDPAKRAERARAALAAGAFGEAVLPGELLALVLKAFASPSR